MRVNGGMVLIISYIKIVFLTVFLLISTFAFSNSWILDKSDYENNQPSLRDCINIMKKGVLVDSKPINRNQPLETYIYMAIICIVFAGIQLKKCLYAITMASLSTLKITKAKYCQDSIENLTPTMIMNQKKWAHYALY